MIPDEAVEAAAKVFYQDGWEGPPFWESLDADDPSRLEYLTTARAALEAAAPHMLAEAFDQGQKSGTRHATRMAAAVRLGRPDLPGPMSPNPYR